MVQNSFPDFIARIFNNKITYILKHFGGSFLSYFFPQFWITQGAGETTYGMLPGFGVLGLMPTLGLIYTLYLTFQKNNAHRPTLIYLWALIIVAAIPAALAKGTYPGNRLASMLTFILILAAYGLYKLP